MKDKAALFASIKHGDTVTITIPSGQGRNGVEYKEVTGWAVMKGPAGWVLNIGGKHGTPKIASPDCIVAVKKARKES